MRKNEHQQITQFMWPSTSYFITREVFTHVKTGLREVKQHAWDHMVRDEKIQDLSPGLFCSKGPVLFHVSSSGFISEQVRRPACLLLVLWEGFSRSLMKCTVDPPSNSIWICYECAEVPVGQWCKGKEPSLWSVDSSDGKLHCCRHQGYLPSRGVR